MSTHTSTRIAAIVDSQRLATYDPPMTGDALAPGSELFGYAIQRVIGKGGMGTVYLAKQLSLGRQVALKVLHPSRIKNQQQIDQFVREAQNAGRFNHPHLVLVHDAHVDAERGLYCYSMEYVPGRTLARMVVERGPLAPSTALHLVYQVAKALAHAHRAGLVHRDVKPDNILVADNGLAKLADLGLVHDKLEGVGSSGRSVLSLVGTPEYSSPEQSRDPKRVTAASDVYSLGACLYFALTGRPPFVGTTVIDTIVKAATETVELPSNLEAGQRTLLGHLLARSASERFADGEAVVLALEALARGGAVTVDQPADDDDTLSDEDAVEDKDAPASGDASSKSNRFRRVRRRRRH